MSGKQQQKSKFKWKTQARQSFNPANIGWIGYDDFDDPKKLILKYFLEYLLMKFLVNAE